MTLSPDAAPLSDPPAETDQADGEPEPPEVAAVLQGLAGLEVRPLAEQVGVLDEAHAALRRALDAPRA